MSGQARVRSLKEAEKKRVQEREKRAQAEALHIQTLRKDYESRIHEFEIKVTASKQGESHEARLLVAELARDVVLEKKHSFAFCSSSSQPLCQCRCCSVNG